MKKLIYSLLILTMLAALIAMPFVPGPTASVAAQSDQGRVVADGFIIERGGFGTCQSDFGCAYGYVWSN